MIVVGIDPGKTGGIVALKEDGTLALSARTENGLVVKGEYDPGAMAAILNEATPSLVVLERQHAMPKQGGTSMFTIGTGYGLWWGVVAALGFRLDRVTAQAWQKAVLTGVSGADTKSRAFQVVRARVPDLELRPGKLRNPHSGLADAACLALYGLTRLGRTNG